MSVSPTLGCLTTCSSPVLYKQISIGKIARWVALGLLDANEVITMKVSWLLDQYGSTGCFELASDVAVT